MYVTTNVSLSLKGADVFTLANWGPQRAKVLVSLAGMVCKSPVGLAHSCSLNMVLMLLPSTLSYTLAPRSTNVSICRIGTWELPSRVMPGGVVSTTFAMSTTVVVVLLIGEPTGAATRTSSSAAWMMTTDIAALVLAPPVLPVLVLAPAALAL